MVKKEEIKEILKEIGNIREEYIDCDDWEKCGVTSRSFVELVVMIEMKYDIEFGDDYLNISKFNDINQVVDYVNYLLHNK